MKTLTSLFTIDRKKPKHPKVSALAGSSERRVKAENKWLGLNLNGGSGGGEGGWGEGGTRSLLTQGEKVMYCSL